MSTELVTRSDFKPREIKIIEPKGRNPKWAYVADYKGKTSVHLREVYQDENEAWCPGKGISFAAGTTAAHRISLAFGLIETMSDTDKATMSAPAKVSKKAA